MVKVCCRVPKTRETHQWLPPCTRYSLCARAPIISIKCLLHTHIKNTENLITKRLGGKALKTYLVHRIDDFSPHSIAETLPSPHTADIVSFLFDNQLLRLWPPLMLQGYVVLWFKWSRMSSAKRNYKSQNVNCNVYFSTVQV